MTKTSFSVSVVVEWYNVTHADADRALRMLAALQSQASDLLCDRANASMPYRLERPLELVIVFNSNQANAAETHKIVTTAIGPTDAVTIRLLPVPGATYCEQKNAGAEIASGEIIIFLDSDVIPEPGWLAAFLNAFTKPDVSIVVGNTYVDHSGPGAYNKAVALTWMFPLRDAIGGLSQLKMFYSNNVAFLRDTFLTRRYPRVPGLTHVPARLLVERLKQEGEVMWSLGDARASHPAPNGAVHFTKRALSGGRARALVMGSVQIATILRWIRDDMKTISYGCKKIMCEGFKVGLRPSQMPAAMTIAVCYHGFFLAGSLLSVVAPRTMRAHFKL